MRKKEIDIVTELKLDGLTDIKISEIRDRYNINYAKARRIYHLLNNNNK